MKGHTITALAALAVCVALSLNALALKSVADKLDEVGSKIDQLYEDVGDQPCTTDSECEGVQP